MNGKELLELVLSDEIVVRGESWFGGAEREVRVEAFGPGVVVLRIGGAEWYGSREEALCLSYALRVKEDLGEPCLEVEASRGAVEACVRLSWDMRPKAYSTEEEWGVELDMWSGDGEVVSWGGSHAEGCELAIALRECCKLVE